MPVDPTESAELILWRQDDCRCELWQINGIGALRVYRGENLLHQELSQTGQIAGQSNQLRRFVVADHTARVGLGTEIAISCSPVAPPDQRASDSRSKRRRTS